VEAGFGRLMAGLSGHEVDMRAFGDGMEWNTLGCGCLRVVGVVGWVYPVKASIDDCSQCASAFSEHYASDVSLLASIPFRFQVRIVALPVLPYYHDASIPRDEL